MPERPAAVRSEQLGRFSALPRPFLRWAGSKQALLGQLLPHIPETSGRYIEPFLGSGSVFLRLKPLAACLSDASQELINVWRAVRDDVDSVVGYLKPLVPNRDDFYRIRGARSPEPVTRAAEFIYLNKTCWNGLYRVNSTGEFNVPYGMPRSDFIFDEDNLRACSRLLNSSGIEIEACDFEQSVARAGSGDLVFLDPPYVTKHNYNGFRDWNEKLFSWSDQERLAASARAAACRGATVIISNADHADVGQLYAGFSKHELSRSSTLASNVSKRGRVTEALFVAGPG